MSDCCKCYYCRPDFGTGWSGSRCALGRNLYTENTDNCKLFMKNDRKHKLEMLAKAIRYMIDHKVSDKVEYYNPFCMVAGNIPQSELKQMPEETIDLLLRFAEEVSYCIRRLNEDYSQCEEIVRMEIDE